MKLLLLFTAGALFAVLASVTLRAYRGEIKSNPFTPLLMIVLTCGIIGGLIAGVMR